MRLLPIVMISFIYFVLDGPSAEAAKPAKADAGKSAKAACSSCHADFTTVLSKDHPKAQGDTIAACTPCHKPDLTGEARKNAFSARMHQAHAGAKTGVECTACHAWVPGKNFGLTGVKGSWGAPTREEMDALKQAFATWATSGYTDKLHAKAGIVCAGCHGKDLPKTSDTIENSRCLSCHGPMEQLAKKSEPADFMDRNPHNSHLGDISCTVCHVAHEVSRVYCLDCHRNFNIKIPGAEKQ